MNKLLSLLVSFALLFTQLAPLGYAAPKKQSNSGLKQNVKNAAVRKKNEKVVLVKYESDKLTRTEWDFVMDMANNPFDQNRWGNVNKVNYLLSLFKKDHQITSKNNIFYKNLETGYGTCIAKCSEERRNETRGKFPVICKLGSSLKEALAINVGTDRYKFDKNANHGMGAWVLQEDKKEEENKSPEKKPVTEKKNSTNGNPNGNKQENIYIDHNQDPSKKIMSSPEGMRALNDLQKQNNEDAFLDDLTQLILMGQDLEEIVKRTVNMYLDNSYDVPVSYAKLETALKAYSYQQQDKGKAGFDNVWHYVEFSLADCEGSNVTPSRIAFVHKAALDALLIRSNFSAFLWEEMRSNSQFREEVKYNPAMLMSIAASKMSKAEIQEIVNRYTAPSDGELNKLVLDELARKGAEAINVEYVPVVTVDAKKLRVNMGVEQAYAVELLGMALLAVGALIIGTRQSREALTDAGEALNDKVHEMVNDILFGPSPEGLPVNEGYNAPAAVEKDDYTMTAAATRWVAGTHGLVGSGAANEMTCQDNGASNPNEDWNGRNWEDGRFPGGKTGDNMSQRVKDFRGEINNLNSKNGRPPLSDRAGVNDLVNAGRNYRGNLSAKGQKTLRDLEKVQANVVSRTNSFSNSAARPGSGNSAFTKASKTGGEWKPEVEIGLETTANEVWNVFDKSVQNAITKYFCGGMNSGIIQLGNGRWIRFVDHERNGTHVHYYRDFGDFICNESIKFDGDKNFWDIIENIITCL